MESKTDHDLLIELNTTVCLMFKEQQRAMAEHIAEDAANFTEVKSIAKAAHNRLDKVFSVKDKIVGGFAVVSFFFGAVVSILALLK
jgi:hypothetical protein